MRGRVGWSPPLRAALEAGGPGGGRRPRWPSRLRGSGLEVRPGQRESEREEVVTGGSGSETTPCLKPAWAGNQAAQVSVLDVCPSPGVLCASALGGRAGGLLAGPLRCGSRKSLNSTGHFGRYLWLW